MPPKKRFSDKVIVYVTAAQKRKLQKVANKEDDSITNVIRKSIKTFLENYKAKKP